MISSIRNRLEQEKGKLQQVKSDKALGQACLASLKVLQGRVDSAQVIIQHVAQKTQEQLSTEVSGLVTMALEAIFPEPYAFRCEFVQRRGKTECDLLFERAGVTHSPMDSAGGGPVDVASLALRVSLWSLTKATRPTFPLDEPMKHLSSDLRPKAAEFIHTLSEEFGLQFIMVTHADEFVDAADKVFNVSMKNGVSIVEEK